MCVRSLLVRKVLLHERHPRAVAGFEFDHDARIAWTVENGKRLPTPRELQAPVRGNLTIVPGELEAAEGALDDEVECAARRRIERAGAVYRRSFRMSK